MRNRKMKKMKMLRGHRRQHRAAREDDAERRGDEHDGEARKRQRPPVLEVRAERPRAARRGSPSFRDEVFAQFWDAELLRIHPRS